MSQNRVKLTTGDTVVHARLGFGEVVEEWGVFRACKLCFAESRSDECAKCGGAALFVSGQGIYDVEFQRSGKVHSVHRHWLTLVRAAPKLTLLREQAIRQAEAHDEWWDDARTASRKISGLGRMA